MPTAPAQPANGQADRAADKAALFGKQDEDF